MSGKDKAIRRLTQYLWWGGLYLAAALFWFIMGFAKGDLPGVPALGWLIGSVAYIVGITVAVRRLGLLKSGRISASDIQPDERAEFISRKAAANAYWLTVVIMRGQLIGAWTRIGHFPEGTAILLLAIVI